MFDNARRALFQVFLLLALTSTASLAADVTGQVSVTGLTLVSSTRVGRTTFDYTYKINVSNNGGALTDVTATVTSSSPNTVILDGSVTVGDLAAASGVVTSDTFMLRQNRTVAFSAASLSWTVSGSPVGPLVEGVLLQGPAGSLASSALFDRIGEDPGPGALANGIIRTRLTGVIRPDATVGEVNAAVASVGGRITAMAAGSTMVDISIPPAADAAEAESLAAILENTGVFVFVSVNYFTDPTTLLPPSMDPPPLSPGEAYLEAVRAPAAWNVRSWLLATRQTAPKTVVRVADYFFNSSHTDLNIAFTPPLSLLPPEWGSNHGWHVAGTIGARFDALNATGIHPAPELLDFKGVHIGRDSWWNYLLRIANTIPTTGKFVLNTSLGYNDYQCIDPPPEMNCWQVGVLAPRLIRPFYKAALALEWRKLVGSKQNRFVHAAAAGNDRTGLPGFPAEEASPWNTASRYGNPCVMVPLAAERTVCQATYQPEISASVLTNVIIVGSARPFIAAGRSTFSNLNEDVAAVGEGVTNLCVQVSDDDACPGANSLVALDGTSMAAPQVAGLAALIWTIDPDLTVDKVRSLIELSVQKPPYAPLSPRVIDAYAAILAIDSASLTPVMAPVRQALLDVVDQNGVEPAVGQPSDGRFSESDLARFVDEIRVRDGWVQDFSRFDLNGDGLTGYKPLVRPFDLNADGDTDDTVVLNNGLGVTISETAVNDAQVLCYYAYSTLFVQTAAFDELPMILLPIADQCGLRLKQVNVAFGTAPTAGWATSSGTTVLSGFPVASLTSDPYSDLWPVFWSGTGTCGSEQGGPIFSSQIEYGATFLPAPSVVDAPIDATRFANRQPCSSFVAVKGRKLWLNATARSYRITVSGFNQFVSDREYQSRVYLGDPANNRIDRYASYGSTNVPFGNFGATSTNVTFDPASVQFIYEAAP